MTLGTWNVQSLNRPAAAYIVASELKAYKIDIVALQETRWIGDGVLKFDDYVFFYGGGSVRHEFGTGFMLHKNLEESIKKFEIVNERMSCITIQLKFHNVTLINIHAPTEDKDDEEKTKNQMERCC